MTTTIVTKKKPLPGQTNLFGGPPVPPPPIAVPVPSVQQLLDARPIKPRRKRGAPGPADIETAARDEALEALDAARADLIAEARKIAHQLARQRGRVTSVEVFQAMYSYGYEDKLRAVDGRFMGCVFRTGEWVRVKWESTGSHKRPVAVWTLA